MTLTLGSLAFSAIATGRRLRMDILVTSAVLSMASRTLEPMSPVAPVRMRCIIRSLSF